MSDFASGPVQKTVPSIWAAATHDLRQPLQGVKLLARVLADEPDEATRHLISSRLEAAAQSLQVMIDRLSEIAVAEAHVVGLRNCPCRLNDLLAEIADAIVPLAASRGGSIVVEPCTQTVMSATHLLREAIKGLVLHALWLDPAAAVTLRARADGPHTIIEVATAARLSPTTTPARAFIELPMTADADTTPFVGLGLRLVEHVVSLLDLTLETALPPDAGTMFAIGPKR